LARRHDLGREERAGQTLTHRWVLGFEPFSRGSPIPAIESLGICTVPESGLSLIPSFPLPRVAIPAMIPMEFHSGFWFFAGVRS
jgi:hypothetical protein